MSRGVKGEPIRQFSVSSPVLTVRRLAKTDTPEEMQCDVVKFGVMHAGPFKAFSTIRARASRLHRVGLPTTVRLSRKLYEIDQRNNSETVPLEFSARLGARP